CSTFLSNKEKWINLMQIKEKNAPRARFCYAVMVRHGRRGGRFLERKLRKELSVRTRREYGAKPKPNSTP
ncbi:MAG: hypothetical protein ACI4QR_05850, partial [Eubacteriales bacterium]